MFAARPPYFFLCSLLLLSSLSAAYFEAALKAYQSGRPGSLKQAEKLYLLALQNEENPALIHYNLGNLYYRTKRVPQAILSYKKVTALAPKFREAYLNLGKIYFLLEEYQKAKQTFEARLKHAPNDYEALLLLGDSYRLLNAPFFAFKAYFAAKEISPRREDAFLALAELYSQLLDDEKALQLLKDSQAQLPLTLSLLNQQASLLQKLNRPLELATLYQFFIWYASESSLTPAQQTELQVKLSQAYYQSGFTNLALHQLKKTVRAHPRQLLSFYALEDLFFELGLFDAAFTFFSTLYDANPKEVAALMRFLLIQAYNQNRLPLQEKLLNFYQTKGLSDEISQTLLQQNNS